MFTKTLISWVLLIIIIFVFGAIVPLVLLELAVLGVGAAVLRRGRRFSSARRTGRRLKE